MRNDKVYSEYLTLLEQAERETATGEPIGFDLALALTGLPDELVPELGRIADTVRARTSGDEVDLCSIISAKTGACAEDCTFCVQSARNGSHCDVHAMRSVDEILEAAKRAEANGVDRFCIVTSGGALTDRDFEIAVEAVGRIKAETGLKRCASLGTLTAEQVARLAEAGLSRYHHNVETARSFFPSICTTHAYDERVDVIRSIKATGIQTCVGGILGMGETPRQRVEMAFELAELDPDSVPVNFLDPRPGTPLEGREPVSAVEAAKYLAIFRLVLPRAYLRLAGGRAKTFAETPETPFRSGVNALLVGDLLTTSGPDVDNDLRMLASLGFDAPSTHDA